jgi:polypeptide N-acetylgalactosaminyltransferase
MPCSRIHHIFRKGGHAYSLPPGHVAKNKLRTAAIWMDEYAFIVREAIGATDNNIEIGSLDEMKALRERLQCKSFDWFLKNVYPEGIITDRSDIRALGEVKHVTSNHCLDTMQRNWADSPVGAYPCHGKGSQRFLSLSTTHELRPVGNLELCLTARLTITWCEASHDTQWDTTAEGQLKSRINNQCLIVDDAFKLQLVACASDAKQRWELPDRSPRT